MRGPQRGVPLIEILIGIGLIGILVGVTVLAVMKHQAARPPSIEVAPFAGCSEQCDGRDDEQRCRSWHWQCEDVDGLWMCSEPMKRTACTWIGPLPLGHPLRRATEGHHVALDLEGH